MTTHRLLFLSLLGALASVFLLSVTLGTVSIPLTEVARIILGLQPARPTWTTIVIHLRLPRTLTALAAGAALGVSGLQMQTLFRNPLADPYILGVSSGASLGVGLITLSGAPWGALRNLTVVTAAALGAAMVLLVMLVVATRLRGAVIVLIIGVMVGYFTSAITSLLVYFANPNSVQRFQTWGFGTFRAVNWGHLPLFLSVLLVGIAASVLTIKQLNAFLLGETYAKSLGVHVRRTRFAILASASLLAGTVTAFCGPIAFLGIAAPHLARTIFGTSDHRVVAWGSLLIGSVMAIACGIFAELPGTNLQLPLNAATAVLGAPVVITVLLRLARTRGDL